MDFILDKPLRSGESIAVTFTFEHAGATTMSVPVELQNNVDDDAECEPADGL